MSVRFKSKEVREHIRKHYPSCTAKHREAIIHLVSRRKWIDVSLGKAVGVVVTNYVRHNLTSYETLMDIHGLAREEARLVEADNVSDICNQWKSA